MKHGGDLTDAMARFGGCAADWLDLSTGINPVPWPVVERLELDIWTRLPAQAELTGLLEQACKSYRVPQACGIVAAPGTQAIIQWLPRIAPDGPVAVLVPTYGEHLDVWQAAGRTVFAASTLDEALSAAPNVVLANPNNPDGRLIPVDALLDAAETIATRGGRLIVDEAFADLDPDCSLAPHMTGLPVVILRSFGKFFGLAGVRLGFAIAQPATADRLLAALGPWAVSGPAIQVGRQALADDEWIAATRRRLQSDATRLTMILEAGGMADMGGTALFRLTRSEQAREIHRHLAAQHIWTRIFDEQPTWIRFGLPGSDTAFQRLQAALASYSGTMAIGG